MFRLPQTIYAVLKHAGSVAKSWNHSLLIAENKDGAVLSVIRLVSTLNFYPRILHA